MELEHKEITEEIIGAAFEVYRVLGYGFLERVCQRAMQVELRSRGLEALIEDKITVRYKVTLQPSATAGGGKGVSFPSVKNIRKASTMVRIGSRPRSRRVR